MTDEQLGRVNKNRQEVHYKPGETIFKSGGPLTHILCLTEGMVKIYLEAESDKKLLLALAKPVQMIGGPGFLVDERHHITVIALEESSVCFINTADFKQVMKTNAEFSMELIKYLNERIIIQYNKIVNLTHKQTHGKIADALLYLSGEVYNNDVFDTPLSRQDMADMSAIRVLKEFVDEGIISCDNHHFEILNKEMLQKISKAG